MQQPNPYAPPEAPVDRPEPPRPAAKKPISAWLVQLFAAAAVIALVNGLFQFAALLLENRAAAGPWPIIVFEFAWRGIALAVMAGTLIGTQRRANFGRWLGLICIALLFVLYGYTQFFRKSAPATSFSQSSLAAGETAGAFFGALLILTLLFWWFCAFGFSEKARKYFQREPSGEKR